MERYVKPLKRLSSNCWARARTALSVAAITTTRMTANRVFFFTVESSPKTKACKMRGHLTFTRKEGEAIFENRTALFPRGGGSCGNRGGAPAAARCCGFVAGLRYPRLQELCQLFLGGLAADWAGAIEPAAVQQIVFASAAVALLARQHFLEVGLLLGCQLGDIDAGDLRVDLFRRGELNLAALFGVAFGVEILGLRSALHGEQQFDFVLEHGVGLRARMLGVDAAVAADEECGGQADDAAIEQVNLLAAVHRHGVIHLEFVIELFHGFRTIVERDADHRETLVAILVLELDEPRNLHLAGTAPRRPEVEQDDLAAVVRQPESLAVEFRQGEIRRLRIVTRSARGDLGAGGDGCDPVAVGEIQRHHQRNRDHGTTQRFTLVQSSLLKPALAQHTKYQPLDGP